MNQIIAEAIVQSIKGLFELIKENNLNQTEIEQLLIIANNN
jgi:hypothetical protein